MNLERSPNRIAASLLFASATLLAAHLPFAGAARAEPDAIGRSLGDAMAGFAATLDDDQRDRALYAFEDDERFDLRLAPLGLEGLRIDEMSEAQWQQLRSALAGVLSEAGLAKVETIRSLEREVAATEAGIFRFVMSRMRNPKRYFLALFGEPGADEIWGMRFDGHHLSLNWTALPEAALSVTPLFLGGQPRQVPDPLERAGLRVLSQEEDRGVALVAALSDEERERARLPFREGGTVRRPMFVGDGPELELTAPAGIARASLGAETRARLDALIDVHLANFAAPIADRHRERIAAQRDHIHFAYAHGEARRVAPGGEAAKPLPPRAGDPFYYRIQGDDFLIEFDDTPADADHVHVVYRDGAGDFGRDALAEHYRSGHPH